VNGQAELLQIVPALRPPGRLAGLLHGRQQERDEDGDDGNDDEQLNERKGRANGDQTNSAGCDHRIVSWTSTNPEVSECRRPASMRSASKTKDLCETKKPARGFQFRARSLLFEMAKEKEWSSTASFPSTSKNVSAAGTEVN
jgi:hypothetical protein